jgi:signal transduction histidine kinase/ligand-binding sensor domain-containing protein
MVDHNSLTRFLVAALLSHFLIPGDGLAQHEASSRKPAVRQDLRFQHLTTDDGLANGVIVSILQDRQGFMWFGTWGGLDRFDGYEFKSYDHVHDDPRSLAGEIVNALVEDRDGAIWAGTGTGLSRLDVGTGRFTNYFHDPDDPESLGGNDVWSLLLDSDGDLWVLTLGGGLNRLDRESDEFERFANDPDDPRTLSSNTGRALHEDHQGYLWIGTQLDGLNRLDRATGEVKRFVHDPQDPGSLSGDDVWVGTRTRGLNRYDRENDRFVRYATVGDGPDNFAGAFVFSLLEDRDGTLWAGLFDGGLAHYDRGADRFLRHLPDAADPDSLSHHQVTELYADAAGGLWIGTFGYGVERLDLAGSSFDLYKHDPEDPQSLGGKDVRAVHEDDEGVFWIGTYDGGLTRFDRTRSRFTHYRHDPADPRSLSDGRIHALHEDRRGDLWVGTWGGGLNRLDRAAGTFERYLHDPADPGSLAENDVRGLASDDDGALWVATRAHGLDRLEPGARAFTHFPPDPADERKIDESLIFTLEGGARGVLWLGLWGGGLNRFDVETGSVTRYRADPRAPEAISSDEVWAIREGSDGYVWLGTNRGLNRLDPRSETFVHFHEGDGLADDVVYDIVEDDRGRLWLTTGVGLSRFDPRSGKFRNFSTADGVLKTSFVDGCAYRSRSGEIFIGGKDGLNTFHPEEIVDTTYVPPVVLTDFRIFNEPVRAGEPRSPLAKDISATDSVTLASDQSVFTIAFSALDYRHPESHQYAYRLEDLEENWNEVGNRRYATYTNLDPGTYTFRVRGSNKDGVANDEGRSLAIRVLPPYWGTWWFRSLAALAAAGLVWGAYGVRTSSIRAHNRALQAEIMERRRAENERERLIRELGDKNDQLEAKNAELERFVYAVSHDLKTPLVTITGFLGLLERDAAAGNADAVSHDAKRIGDAAGRMKYLLDDLLELSRVGRVANPPEPVALGELVRSAVCLVDGPIRERGVEVVVEEPMPEAWGDRGRLLEVVQNLLGNAVKFMGAQEAPRIVVRGIAGDDHVRCSVSDNGIGIDPRYHESIFGLFDRLDSSIEGTGVGLALVKRIIEVHGGKIWVESEGEGKGSCFTFTLPRTPG